MAEHETIVAALRTALALLDGDATSRRQQQQPAALKAALALDAERRTNGHRATTNGTGTGPKAKGKPEGYGAVHAKAARRARTLKVLQEFDRVTPRPFEDFKQRGGGPLVAHGYLAKRKGGYVRTAKEFRP